MDKITKFASDAKNIITGQSGGRRSRRQSRKQSRRSRTDPEMPARKRQHKGGKSRRGDRKSRRTDRR